MTDNSNLRNLNIAFIASYSPRKCGIATFTFDLIHGLQELFQEGSVREEDIQVIAMNNISQGYDYPNEVNFEIRDKHLGDYREAAAFLNLSSIDAVSLQHEFGIFGGTDGNHIVCLLNNLRKPLITTLHTVLENPSPGQEETLNAIISKSTLIVVLASKAVDILKKVYKAPEDKIIMIPHGAPDVSFLDSSYYKSQFQAEDRPVILSFGLLSPNKGFEYTIEAMAQVVQNFPEALYIILGATHPEVKRHSGEQYRFSLANRVKELDLQHNVVFHNRYVTLEQLVQFLVAADIYITPYLSKEQIVSGTLAYALACGKAIVSTPYWYAEELLAKGRGILVPFRNSKAIADKVCTLLDNDSQRNRLRKRAYQYGRHMIWREVASRYDAAFEQAVAEYGKRKTAEHIYYRTSSPPSIPEINLNHLYTLTDDTGILAHALFSTPSRIDGYMTDDNARALMVAVMLYQLHQDEKILNLSQTYLAFLNYAIDPKSGQVRNRMSYERRWSAKDSSEDCHGRALWSLGYTILYAPDESILSMANFLFKLVIKGCESLSSPRAWAYSILGCLDYLQRLSGDTETNSLVSLLGKRLLKLYKNNKSDEWLWFEESLSYANARLPQALIASGQHLGNRAMVKQGIEALEWLIKIQENPKTGYLSLVGNAGWYSKGGKKANFDQQPVEITSIIDACHQAYLATGQKTWIQKIEKAFAWFLGRNDKNEFLYDFKTGGCYDGLHRGGVNHNQGAESLLSWLSARHVIYQISHKSSDSTLKKNK